MTIVDYIDNFKTDNSQIVENSCKAPCLPLYYGRRGALHEFSVPTLNINMAS